MTPFCLDFTGRRVLITGATRGIGAALADCFEAAGAELVLTGTSRSSTGPLHDRAERAGLKRTYVEVDFSDDKSLDSFLTQLPGLGPFDVCVNNAGVNRIKPVDAVSRADFDWLIGVNLRAPLLTSQAVVAGMRVNGAGRIVNVASIWSVVTRPGRSLYAASKAGLVGLTRTLSAEVAQYGILVNAVSPGFTDTDLTRRSLSADEIRQLEAQIPAGRLAKPVEIAAAVLFLSSNLNTYITGQNIVVDGGFVTV